MRIGLVRRIAGVATVGLMTVAVTGPGAKVASGEEAPPPVAVITNLTGVFTSVKLDPGFVRALGSIGVAPSPSGTATIADGRPKFPITGGNLTIYKPGEISPYVQGRIEHTGSGLNLTKGGTTVTIEDFVIDPGDPAVLTGTVLANGKVAADSVKLFDLNGSTLEPIMVDTAAGLTTLTGTTMTLSDEAAEMIGGVFQTDALIGGTPIGVVTILVDTTSNDTPIPHGGDTGVDSTSGTEDTSLIVGAVLLLLGVVGVVLVARRRHSR